MGTAMTDLVPKILLVDDKPMNLRLYRMILEPLSAEILEAESGVDALQAVQENDFALVILDCSMPGMDGFATARQLRLLDRASRVPIIFFTAEYTSQVDIREGYELGAVDFGGPTVIH